MPFDLPITFTRKKPKLPVPKTFGKTLLGNSTLFGRIAAGHQPLPVADPWAEAQAKAQQLSQPILNILTQRQAADEANARAVAQQNKRDLDASYAAQGPMIDKSYDQAIASNSVLEDAVAKHLQASGTGATTDLKKQLEFLGAPGADAEVAKLADVWKGAGGAEYATGTSDIQNLVSDKAATHTLLGKQQISDTHQIGKDLSAAIAAIAKDAGVAQVDVLKSLPAEIQQIYSDTQAQKADARDYKEKTREYNKEYAHRSASELQDRADARHKLALETKLTMQQTMSAAEYKRWAKKFDAQQKALDRQSRQQIAAADRQAKTTTKLTGQDFTGPANRKFITVQDANGVPQVVKNPNYVPPVKSAAAKGSDTVDTAGSAKRNRAYTNALAAVFNKNTGRVRDVVIYGQDPNMKALKLINAALKGQGVDPYSSAGNQIRQSIWGFLDGKKGGTPGKTGTFTDPRRDDPRFKRKKKK